MSVPKAALLALSIVLIAAPAPAFAQTDKPDKPVDLKPFIPPILPPMLLPPNSYLTPGTVTGVSPSPYSSGTLYDSSQPQPAPGLRLTIPR